MEHDQAILLRLYPFQESSLIVVWLSQHHGLLRTVAKGAKRPKSPLRGKLDLFYTCEITWTGRSDNELQTLAEVAMPLPRCGISRSYLHALMASYFVRLVELLVPNGSPSESVFDLLKRGLDFLDQQAPTLKAMHHFERELCRLEGIWQDQRTPHQCLESHLGFLPDQRQDLLKRLDAETP